jgi:hypothetical protein
MRTEHRCIEFFVLSYVPQVVSDEKYNLALIALERRDDRTSFADARFIADTKELLVFDPDADVNMLTALFREIEQALRHPEDADVFLEMMLDSFSNVIQISDRKTVIISGEPASEVTNLAALYISAPGGISGRPHSQTDE